MENANMDGTQTSPIPVTIEKKRSNSPKTPRVYILPSSAFLLTNQNSAATVAGKTELVGLANQSYVKPVLSKSPVIMKHQQQNILAKSQVYVSANSSAAPTTSFTIGPGKSRKLANHFQAVEKIKAMGVPMVTAVQSMPSSETMSIVSIPNLATAAVSAPYNQISHEILIENNHDTDVAVHNFTTISSSDNTPTSSNNNATNLDDNKRVLRSGNAYNLLADDNMNRDDDYFDRNSPEFFANNINGSPSRPSYKMMNHHHQHIQSSISPSHIVNVSSSEDDMIGSQFTHPTKTSPATIQWLLQNYETADGVSLPRCTLYDHYLQHCSENRLEPVNSASFGKLIRSVFLGLRTRRLGTRGNSKYHYYGIRIKADSELNKAVEEANLLMQRHQNAKKIKLMNSNCTVHHSQVNFNQSAASVNSASTQSLPSSNNGVLAGSSMNHHHTTNSSILDEFKNFLGPGILPDFAVPQRSALLESQLHRIGLSLDQAEKFFIQYHQHCEDIMECVKHLLFNDVESCWRQFWQSEENNGSAGGGDLDEELDEDDESNDANLTGLTRTQLYSMCTLPVVQQFIQAADFQFYQALVNVLVPDVLKQIPSQLTQLIRSFAKNLENSLAVAVQGAPEIIVKIKLDAVSSFAQTLRRYTTLNHLAQAARAVFQNPVQIGQMLNDLNRVDFRNMHEQASWVCYCNLSQVEELEKSFKLTLEKQITLEQWAVWLENVIDRVLHAAAHRRPIQQTSSSASSDFAHSAKEFLLKWSFYSSMIMRDLTLRSAPSFGSFHLIRLLYDEYMFYLIEQRIARATGQTTVAMMSQSYRNHIHFDGHVDYFNNCHVSYTETAAAAMPLSSNMIGQQDETTTESYGHVMENPGSIVADNHVVVTMTQEESVSAECYLNGHSDDVEEFLIPAHHETITITADNIEDTAPQPIIRHPVENDVCFEVEETANDEMTSSSMPIGHKVNNSEVNCSVDAGHVTSSDHMTSSDHVTSSDPRSIQCEPTNYVAATIEIKNNSDTIDSSSQIDVKSYEMMSSDSNVR